MSQCPYDYFVVRRSLGSEQSRFYAGNTVNIVLQITNGANNAFIIVRIIADRSVLSFTLYEWKVHTRHGLFNNEIRLRCTCELSVSISSEKQRKYDYIHSLFKK